MGLNFLSPTVKNPQKIQRVRSKPRLLFSSPDSQQNLVSPTDITLEKRKETSEESPVASFSTSDLKCSLILE